MINTAIIDNTLKPDLIDEVSENEIYLGFLDNNGAVDTPTCRIVRLAKTGTVTTRQYPGGSDSFAYIWNDRQILTYAFKK